jgi:hypothetical protein
MFETNVDVSVYVLHVILSDISIPIGGEFETGHPDGMHAILCNRFDVVKVLPLHEVERATAVEIIRYGRPFIRVHGILDLAVRLANRTSEPRKRFLGGIVKRPEEITVRVDVMGRLITASLRWDRLFVFLFVTQEEPGVREGDRKNVSKGSSSSPPDGEDV